MNKISSDPFHRGRLMQVRDVSSQSSMCKVLNFSIVKFSGGLGRGGKSQIKNVIYTASVSSSSPKPSNSLDGLDSLDAWAGAAPVEVSLS
eukprot:m.260698 g.260698  ORF g.260698 m.260698 type:complete len:90 (-) comp15990_c0_seq16:2110-2379(-)